MKGSYSDRIVKDPTVCGGSPVIKGTRIRIKVILDNLAEGQSTEEIIKSYPGLSHDDVEAVIVFAAASITDDLYYPVPEAITAL
jgi:uncharacterized protein (DUF433 family)